MPNEQVKAHLVGTFSNKTLIFLFPYLPNGKIARKCATSDITLEMWLPKYIIDCFEANDYFTSGLQLVRYKYGCSTITAHRRINDLKITIQND